MCTCVEDGGRSKRAHLSQSISRNPRPVIFVISPRFRLWLDARCGNYCDIMVHRSLPLLLLPLVGSFVLPSIRPLHSDTPFRERPCQHVNFNRAAVRSDPAGALSMRRTPSTPACRRSSRLRSQQEQASAADTAVSEPPAPQALPEFISNDGVSYWVHEEKESNIWLAGVVHGTKAGEKLAAEVISGVKPEVVMVELDAHRISLLPPGEAMETRNGLWWWSPEEEEEASDETDDGDDEEEDDDEIEPPRDMSEISVAVREAQACGARVLLGDRDYETTARLLKKAKRADMASAKEREKFSELTASFDCEESTREVTRKECAQMKQQAPKVFAVMCTQRDQVMAKHLMKLRGEQTTVAIFGLAHLDGVEKVLRGHGWKRQRPQS